MKKRIQANKLSASRFLFLLIFTNITGLLLVLSTYHLAYRQKIFPGVSLAQIPVGNLSFSQASKLIQKSLPPSSQTIEFIASNQKFSISCQEIDLQYQIQESVSQAFNVGRQKNIFNNLQQRFTAWNQGINLPLSYQIDQSLLNQKIASIAAEIYVPPVDPSIEIITSNQTKQAIVNPGQPGKELDRHHFRQELDRKIASLDFSPSSLYIATTSPVLSLTEVEKIAQRANFLLGKKLKLISQDKEWTIDENQLINFLSFQKDYNYLKIVDFTSEIAKSIDHEPVNASFQFQNDKVIEFKPAQNGLSLNQFKTIDLIQNALIYMEKNPSLENVFVLPVETIPPQITTENVNGLGIKNLLGKGESWFAGSISSRIHNLQLASSKLNGELITPQEIFSFNHKIGEVSEATGYQKAYIIQEGRTILGDGGGVCQVSTTLFRAVLNAGLNITERHAHAYRVSYYEQRSSVGQDATVYDPTADFQFQNDTSAYILIQTKIDLPAKKLTFELYGSPDNRQVEISKSRIWDQTPPPPTLYQDDPTLLIGTTKQIDWEAWGAKVAFDWKVTLDQQTLHQKTFFSQYRPWQAIYLKGTKNH